MILSLQDHERRIAQLEKKGISSDSASLLDELAQKVRNIEARNQLVEADKAWETSWARRVSILILTYIVTASVFYAIDSAQPLRDAVIPTSAFILSTLVLPFGKKPWLQWIRKQKKNHRLTVYLSHSRDYDFKDMLYRRIRESEALKKYHFIFPHEGGKEFNSKDAIKGADLVIAEVSMKSTGQGIELGWADMLAKPIIVIHLEGKKISESIRYVASSVVSYKSYKDIPDVIKNAVKKELER